ncbi:ABC transporter substrate-binding protein [Xanthobacter flavus]|uniref:ABC transporter substrate-binding protein n=1 Tax=Xanthobacter flavus TaxID=281 RepID=UPI003726689C
MRVIHYVVAVSALLMASPLAAAEQDTKPIRIAVLNDQSGIYAEVGGFGSVVAARLAAEEFGGEMDGRKIEVVGIDHQNKPDIAAAAARKGIAVDGFNVIADGASSAAALAINEVTKANDTIFIVAGGASTEFTGKSCGPETFQFTYDTYALANGTANAIVKQGGDTWFFITADYVFGHALQKEATKFIEKAGGKVVGSVKHPTGTQDFSSFLLQAQASRAKIIGLANAGADTINAVKQGGEFGVVEGGQNFAGLLIFLSDVHAMGLEKAKGLLLTTSFYWDLTDQTRKFASRFGAQMNGRMPTMIHAGVYSGVKHYLKAVKATGSVDPRVVADKMRQTPVNDAYNTNVEIRPDGRVMHDMYLMQVKSPAESKGPYDYYKVVEKIPGKDAFKPLSESECPLVKNAQN